MKQNEIIPKNNKTPVVPPTTPRNFVAKNAKSSGAGAHADKKRDAKRGVEKHKKDFSPMDESADQGLAEGKSPIYVGRETKEGTWHVFQSGPDTSPLPAAGPFKSSTETAAWIKKAKEENIQEAITSVELDEATLTTVSGHRAVRPDTKRTYKVIKDHGIHTHESGAEHRVFSVQQPNGFHGVLVTDKNKTHVIGQTFDNHDKEKALEIANHYKKSGQVGMSKHAKWYVGGDRLVTDSVELDEAQKYTREQVIAALKEFDELYVAGFEKGWSDEDLARLNQLIKITGRTQESWVRNAKHGEMLDYATRKARADNAKSGKLAAFTGKATTTSDLGHQIALHTNGEYRYRRGLTWTRGSGGRYKDPSDFVVYANQDAFDDALAWVGSKGKKVHFKDHPRDEHVRTGYKIGKFLITDGTSIQGVFSDNPVHTYALSIRTAASLDSGGRVVQDITDQQAAAISDIAATKSENTMGLIAAMLDMLKGRDELQGIADRSKKDVLKNIIDSSKKINMQDKAKLDAIISGASGFKDSADQDIVETRQAAPQKAKKQGVVAGDNITSLIHRNTAQKVQSTGNHNEFSWTALGEDISVEDRMRIVEEYGMKGRLTESLDEDKKDYFVSLFDMSDTPIRKQPYIVVSLALVGNNIMNMGVHANLKFIGKTNRIMRFDSPDGEKSFPTKTMRDLSVFNTFTFLSEDAYDKFRSALAIKFDISLPEMAAKKHKVALTAQNKENKMEKSIKAGIERAILEAGDKKQAVLPNSTPRNFVAKNAKSSGTGAHADKKKDAKRGIEKHKKDFSTMDESADQSVAEGDVVQFPQKHPWYAAKTCPKCEGSLVGGKTADGRVKYCMGCGAVYPEPNTNKSVAEAAKWRSNPNAYGVDDEGNKSPKTANMFSYDPLAYRQNTVDDSKTARGKKWALKTSIKMAKGQHGPKGILPEQNVAEGDNTQTDKAQDVAENTADKKSITKIASLEKKINDAQDALGLARERRKMKGQRQQGPREMALQKKIDDVRRQIDTIKREADQTNESVDLGDPSANPVDVIALDVPLMIRIMEYAREDAKTDMDLHVLAEKMIELCTTGQHLTMQDYDAIIQQEPDATNDSDAMNISESIAMNKLLLNAGLNKNK